MADDQRQMRPLRRADRRAAEDRARREGGRGRREQGRGDAGCELHGRRIAVRFAAVASLKAGARSQGPGRCRCRESARRVLFSCSSRSNDEAFRRPQARLCGPFFWRDRKRAMNDPTTLRRLYGRSKGRPLRAGQSDAGRAAAAGARGAGRRADRLPARCSATTGRCISRSASARGEHLAWRADLLPDHGFIGAEPFLNGVAGALGHIRDRQLANVRLHMGDALEVLERLPERVAALRLPAPSRSLAQGAPRQAPDGQSRPARPDRGQAGAGRRVPARHRRSRSIAAGR